MALATAEVSALKVTITAAADRLRPLENYLFRQLSSSLLLSFNFYISFIPFSIAVSLWVGGYSQTRTVERVASSRRIRVGSWNVGTLTGKFLELVDALKRKKVDIACFQETKWKGSRNRELNQYKLWISDRIMLVRLVIKEETINVISAYSPQVGLGKAEKKSFWDSLDDLVRECSTTQQFIVAGDLNSHNGANADGFSSVHGGFGGDHDTQIDYMLVRKGDLRLCKDCKVFPGEVCFSQHRLLVLDIHIKKQPRSTERAVKPRILWKNLYSEVPEDFKARVIEGVTSEEENRLVDVEQMCNRLENMIREAAKETLGVVFRELISLRGEDEANRSAVEERYKEAKREAKKALKPETEGKGDLGIVRFIKDEDGRSIVNEDAFRRRWKLHTKVKEALWKMGRNKAVGPDEIPIEAWRCFGGEGVRWLTILFNKTFLRAKMPEEWRLSEVIPIYKNKGDAQTCSNYRGIKLLSHTMKLWERVIERRSLMEKYRERQKDLHLAFLDLEKTYDSVPRELIWKTLSDKGTLTRYIKVIQDIYKGARTCVRTPTRNTEYFPIDVGLHQGSAISPYLFSLILDELMKGIQESIPCRNENDRNEEEEIRIGEHILEPKESFRYLGSVIHKSGRIEDNVTHHIQVGWLKWRAATRILYDKKVPLKLKGKFYRVAIRPAMLYGSECWSLTKVQANRMEVAKMRMEVTEIRMLRRTCVNIVNKMRERQLRWFGNVKRRPQSAPVRRVKPLTVNRARRKGRPKLRWEDRLKTDLKELLLSKDITSDRSEWRTRIRLDEGFLALWLFAPLLSFFPLFVACLCFYCFSAGLPASLLLCRYVSLSMPACLVLAIPLPLGRGVTVYISPPLYPIFAGLSNVVVVVVVVVVQKGNNTHKKQQPQLAARGPNQGKGKNKLAYAPKPKIPPPPKRKIPQRTQSVMSVLSTEIVWGCEALVKRDTLTKPNKLEPSLITQEASGSLEDLEIIQEEDTHPSIDTSLNHEDDDLEIDEPQRDLGEPANYKAALLDPESDKWLNAMNVEMQSMKDNEVWDLVDLPPNGKTVGIKWLFKKKTDMDGAVYTYKARLVVKGYTQTPRINYEETFYPVADIRAIRILIAIAAFYDYEIWQMDVKTSFLNGYLSKEVYMEQPKEAAAYDASKEAVWVRKFISGLGVVPMIEKLISMYYDNTGAITITNESGITKGARHFHAKVHYLREVIEFGDIKLEKVHTDDNLADPFTKALAFPNH
ncbi:retrovirus-related pol polyprotein LINE-1 [Tanacetum coccineum]